MLADLARVEQDAQVRDGEVAEEGARVGRDDGEVGVFSFEGDEECLGDGVGGVDGEGGGGVEIFYCGLGEVGVSLTCERVERGLWICIYSAVSVGVFGDLGSLGGSRRDDFCHFACDVGCADWYRVIHGRSHGVVTWNVLLKGRLFDI